MFEDQNVKYARNTCLRKCALVFT